jgi:mandelamide amidase
MVPAALGTDTGASVRLPAALCGVVGFRPTVGRYSGTGIIPISHTRDTAGPITRSVEDAALMDSVLCGAAVSLDKLDLKGLRLGVPRVDFYQGADAEVLDAMEALLEQLSRAGVSLVEGDVAGMSALNAQVGFPVALYELTVDLPAYLAHNRYKLTLAQIAEQIASPDVAGIVGSQLGDQAMPRAAYEAALKARVHLQAVYAEHFASHRLDALVFPTTVLPARPIGQDETVELNGAQVPTFPTYIRNTDPGSNAGIPGISIPMGLTKAGLPLGLELDGPAASDRRLLAVAAAIEALLPPMPAPKR